MFKRYETSPTRTIVALVTTTLVVSAAMWSMGPLAGGPALALGGPDPDFADLVAGTWITDPQPGGQWNPAPIRYLVSIHADGTLEWSANWEYGPVGGWKTSNTYGSWTQTGPEEFTSREMWLLYSHDSINRRITRFTTVYTFSDDFKTFTAELHEELFLPEQDPTNPDEEPVSTFSDNWTAKRLDAPA